MKDLLFSKDLATLLQHDAYYGNPGNLLKVLRKLGVQSTDANDSVEKMMHALVVNIMDQGGESEPFLEGTFIYSESIIALLKGCGLPAPTALLPPSSTRKDKKEPLDDAQYEQLFDTVCRNCGTVTDPLALNYRTPIGRLIFKTFLTTRQTLGINSTGHYVLEHLKDFDTDKIIKTLNEDSVIWKTRDGKEKITSVQTISKFVLNFNRELENLL